MCTSSGAYESNHECARTESERIPIIDFRDKTKVQMFYFDSNTTASRQYDALVFLESVC